MPHRGYSPIHGELAALGIKVAASAHWEILREHRIPPIPERQTTTWADFLCSQTDALLACDLFETRALTGARLYVFVVIEHSTRRIRILGITAHPTAQWVVQLGSNLLMDLEDAGNKASLLVRDRDSRFTAAIDAVLVDAGFKVFITGIQVPRMNSTRNVCRRRPSTGQGGPSRFVYRRLRNRAKSLTRMRTVWVWPWPLSDSRDIVRD